MLKYKVLVFILASTLLLLQTFCSVQAQDFEWNIGEELTYKVKWSFLRLGTLRLQVLDTLRQDELIIYHTRLFMDSNPMLFFVNMHNIYDTYIDQSFRPHFHLSQEKIDGIDYRTEHRFNYLDSTMLINITGSNDSAQIVDKKEKFSEILYDGITMTFYARMNVVKVRRDTLKSYFGDKLGDVLINFRGEQRQPLSENTKLFDKTYLVDGNILMVGIAGITGPFIGWFGGTKTRVPIKAQLKVFLGSVNVELENISTIKDSPADQIR